MKSLLSFLLTSVLILTVSSQILCVIHKSTYPIFAPIFNIIFCRDFSKVVYDTLNYVVDTAATMTGVREV